MLYHMAEPTDVTLRTCAESGALVQTLALGRQSIDIYGVLGWA